MQNFINDAGAWATFISAPYAVVVSILFYVKSLREPILRTKVLPSIIVLVAITVAAIDVIAHTNILAPKDPRAALTQHYHQSYNRERVVIDGSSFIQCTFQDVTLVYNGGLTNMDSDIFNRVTFTSDKLEVVAVIAMLAQLDFLKVPFINNGIVINGTGLRRDSGP
jgi:uncharacterized protein (UPF0333 family)